MNPFFKSIFVTLTSTLALNFSFGLDIHMIELRLDPNTHQLIDPGTTDVHRGDDVIWQIRTGENIEWIHITGAGHPFTNNLPGGTYITWRGGIRGNAHYGTWKYKIHYKLGKSQTPVILDPKIAVKPTTSARQVILIVALAITAITSIVFFRKWRTAKAELEKYRNQNV